MREINLDLLKQCANNLMFEMKDEEYQTLLNEFDVLLKQMSLIGMINGIDDAQPMTFPFDCANSYLREDVEEETLSKDDVLFNAKEVVDGQIKLPKVVG